MLKRLYNIRGSARARRLFVARFAEARFCVMYVKHDDSLLPRTQAREIRAFFFVFEQTRRFPSVSSIYSRRSAHLSDAREKGKRKRVGEGPHGGRKVLQSGGIYAMRTGVVTSGSWRRKITKLFKTSLAPHVSRLVAR